MPEVYRPDDLAYLGGECGAILSSLVAVLAVERPDDVPAFMLRWLCEQTRWDTAAGGAPAGLEQELARQRCEVAELAAQRASLSRTLSELMDSQAVQVRAARASRRVRRAPPCSSPGAEPHRPPAPLPALSPSELLRQEQLVAAAPLVRVLAASGPRRRAFLAEAARAEVFRRGEVAARRGQPCRSLRLVTKGEFAGDAGAAAGAGRRASAPGGARRYAVGECFGAAALLPGRPRCGATVAASTEGAELLSLDRAALRVALSLDGGASLQELLEEAAQLASLRASRPPARPSRT